MIATERVPVLEPDNLTAQRLRRGLTIAALGFGILFALGMIIGILIAHAEKGGEMSFLQGFILSMTALAAAGFGWLLIRTLRAPPAGEDPLTAKERLNRNILIACGAMGGLLGLAMAAVEPKQLADGASIFSNSPLPPAFALVVVLLTGVLLPAISIYWHRHATDEMEADAYKTGALYALNVYMIGAPVWWFLWRGGLAPAPDGVAIYLITVATVGVIWLWKKYR